MLFQILAVGVLLLFYGCYFGKLFSQKKRGIQTDQIGKGKKGIVKFIEITMKIATIVVPIVEIINIVLNFSLLPTGVRCVGGAIAVIGTAMFICSVVTMRDSWRAGVSETDKTELITTGIYENSRNPAFLGFDLVYLGIVLMFFSWTLFATSAFAALMFHIQIVNVEEVFLLGTFGKDYLDYQNTVNRYWGRKGKR